MRKFKSKVLEKDYCDGLIIDPFTIVELAKSNEVRKEVIRSLEKINKFGGLDSLDKAYLEYLRNGCKIKNWQYVGPLTILFAATKLLKVSNYLEIGVRRGRSVSCVVAANPQVNIFCFDNWIKNYAHFPNGGEVSVRRLLKKIGHTGKQCFFNGDSHKTIPKFITSKNRPNSFDLIFVDGDHSFKGAYDDLKNVIKILAPGGILVFDDIAHPPCYYLYDVWKKLIKNNPQLHDYTYTALGTGIALAINRSDFHIRKKDKKPNIFQKFKRKSKKLIKRSLDILLKK